MVFLVSSWKELRNVSSTNDDDNDAVCMVVFLFSVVFLLLPMMILVVRVRPEGRILQPFCLLRVWDGWFLQENASIMWTLGLGLYCRKENYTPRKQLRKNRLFNPFLVPHNIKNACLLLYCPSSNAKHEEKKYKLVL